MGSNIVAERGWSDDEVVDLAQRIQAPAANPVAAGAPRGSVFSLDDETAILEAANAVLAKRAAQSPPTPNAGGEVVAGHEASPIGEAEPAG